MHLNHINNIVYEATHFGYLLQIIDDIIIVSNLTYTIMANYSDFYSIPSGEFLKNRHDRYFGMYFPLFPEQRNSKILDLGCGYGIFLDSCRTKGYKNLYGIEQGQNWVEYAQKELELKNVEQGDIFEYLKRKEKYDVITAFNVLEHIPKNKVHELFDMIFDSLNPGGVFIFEVPNAESQHGLTIFFSDLTHEWCYSRRLLDQLFKIHGFVNPKLIPSDIRKNISIRIAQKILTKITSGHTEFMYSSNIIGKVSKPDA